MLPVVEPGKLADRYAIPAGFYRVEDEILRSRFITSITYTPTVDEARAFLDRIRLEFPNATHHCWAYLVGSPGSTARIGLSDDGEPHGTAGRPMLNALLHSGIGDVCVVVTRYFGGTFLGKGGLVRAYSSSVINALDRMARAEHREYRFLEIIMGYEHVARIQNVLPRFDGVWVEESYGADAQYKVKIPSENVGVFLAELNDATDGQVLIFDE